MKKTYVTTMPDNVGAFLRASRRIAALGINITRVSYDKAVDLHTLFIELDADEDKLRIADAQLAELGYVNSPATRRGIVLLEFKLRDEPGSVTAVLELIARYNLNISYISSHEDGSGYQRFRMGLLTDADTPLDEFVHQANALCPTHILDLSQLGRNYDNSVFYASFVGGLARCMGLGPDSTSELMINVNRAMQTLDERNLAPQTTFDCISHFAELLARGRGEGFKPRITRYDVAPETTITLIEPPCGSNTAVISSRGKYLCVDTGYACYRDEMLALLRKLIPGFDSLEKVALITHADVDHCGLLPLFDQVLMSARSHESLLLEYQRRNAYREQNALHAPYIRICKVLTGYAPSTPERLKAFCGAERIQSPLEPAGRFEFGELNFDVFEGAGGHLPGEIVLIDYAHGIAFAGDIYINMKGMTPEQAEYNRYAPILMTSVDTDKALAAAERAALMRRLGAGEWLIFGGHGQAQRYCVTGER